MRILVVGAGAVGGYFGARLTEAKRDVTLLVWSKRAEEIKAKGLQILGLHGNLTVHPKTVTSSQITGPYDVILLSVKSYSLSGAMNDFATAVGPETMIVPVLNGMRHMDLLAERFGKQCILGGVCMVPAELDGEGRIRQLADFQRLSYGELDGQITPRIRRLDEALRSAGFESFVSTRILADMWQKWVHLATLGSINCLLRGNLGEVASVKGGGAVALEALRECAGIACACGFPQSEEFLEEQRGYLNVQESKKTCSIYRDLMKGAPVEADSILGDLWERGQKLGLQTPILQAAFVNLSIYQRSRERAKAEAAKDD